MNTYKINALLIGTLMLINLPGSDGAAAENPLPDQKIEKQDELAKNNELTKKLRSNEPSYFVLARDNNDTFSHIEFYLSVEYPLLERGMRWMFGKNASLNFNYNGKYDFYLNSRYSSPIISRRQNPGLMFDYQLDNSFYGLQSIKSGYFHESNGQTIDTAAEYAVTENGCDFVSRGWDYIPLELKFKFPALHDGLSFYFKGRYFLAKQFFKIDTEDEIFWDPTNDSTIEDYDGLSVLISQTVAINPYLEGFKLTAIYRTGYTDFNLSQRYEATFRVLDIPLYIFYSSGYGMEISTYNERGYTWGVGFELW